jgi:hypothetical protein
MGQESATKESKPFTISLTFGPSGGVFTFTIDPADKINVEETLNEILRLAKAPLVEQIEALKKRVLSDDEIQRLAHLLRTNSSETRLDGRPTSDDLLADKLEATLPNPRR